MSDPHILDCSFTASGAGAIGIDAQGPCNIDYTIASGATYDIQVEPGAIAHIYASRYITHNVLGTLVADQGDRAAWDDLNYATRHAYDISAATFTYHNNPASPPVLGTGTVGRITQWTAAHTIGDSTLEKTGAGLLTLTAGSAASLAVTGSSSISGSNTGDQTITLTGDVTGSGTGTFTTTLATVNANVGTFGDATHVGVFTVNAKGLITAASSVTITSITSANPSAIIGLSAVNGVATTYMTSDSAPPLSQNIVPTWRGIHTFRHDAIGVTSTDGIVLDNTTAAAVGAQQFSPRIRLVSQGWKTDAVAASQIIDWIIEGQPIQDSSTPTGTLVISHQINGGGYLPMMTMRSGPSYGDQVEFDSTTPGYPVLTVHGEYSDAQGGNFILRKSRAGGTDVQVGDALGGFLFQGMVSGVFQNSAAINAEVVSIATLVPRSKIKIATAAGVGGALADVVTIDNTGIMVIIKTTDATSPTTGILQVSGGAGIAKAIWGGSTLSLAGTSNQIVLQASGVTGTLTWTPTSSGKVATIPDLTGTFAFGAGSITSTSTNDVTVASHTHAIDATIITTAIVTGGANPTGTIGLTAVNGSALTYLRSDGAPALSQAIVPTWTGIHTFRHDAIGSTSTDGIVLDNTTAAAVGAQQWSPRLRLTGRGWNGDTVSSEVVDWIIENQPKSVSHAQHDLVISYQRAGGGYVERFRLSTSTNVLTSGALSISDTTDSTSTITGALQVAGGVGIAKGLNVGGQSAFGSTINAAIGADFGFTSNTSNIYGIRSLVTLNNTTTLGMGVYGRVITTAASFTLATAAALFAGTPTKGSGSTITTAAGLYIQNQNQGSTNYAIYSEGGDLRFDGVAAANGSVATVLGSVGATGSHTTVQEWLKVNIGGNVRYIPCF